MALIPVADDQVAAVVTTLEMRARPRPAPMPDATLRLVAWPAPSPAAYRALFTRVGAPWLWFSRLTLDDAALTAIVHDAQVQVHAAVDAQGIEVGMIELDFRHGADTCRLAYFALIPELVGRGIGRWLMAHAMMLAWRPGVARVVVDTCTLDHPRALGFYRAAGFVAVRRTLETFADPRVAGLLPETCAPHVPRLANRR